MLLKLIVIGKLKDRAYQERCADFFRRLGAYGKAECSELPDSDVAGEGKAILRELDKERNSEVIVLTEEGGEFTTRQLAERFRRIDRKIVLVIGGPYGLAPEVKSRADWLLALSKLTFTHELARLICCEQLYRVFNLLHGGAYHH